MVIVSKWLPIRFSVLCYASGLAEAADTFGVIIGAGVRMLGRVKDAYIAAKERWARKMAGQKPHKPRSANRLPPGQRLVQDFPVLDLGVRPEMPLEKWELKIQGQVDNPVTLTWPQFLALPQFKDVSDFHCVTTWSQFDMEWEGVAARLLQHRRPVERGPLCRQEQYSAGFSLTRDAPYLEVIPSPNNGRSSRLSAAP
jgi:DMSO/TMAO reductase YedYZ molybdopterin-dependent catalytic subunit